jgi:exoribonuclease-2
VVEASRATRLPPLALLQQAGAIASPYQFHWQRFLLDHFPKGTGFPALQAPPITDELPLAAVQAYSIDDSQTTEIDDALSVQGLGSGTIVVGIHIAAPGLAITPGSAIDLLGRQRLSTVYMPGYKITMLPDEVVQTYTLSRRAATCPAVSLYATFDEATLALQGHRNTRWSACQSPPTCATTSSTAIDHGRSLARTIRTASRTSKCTVEPSHADRT